MVVADLVDRRVLTVYNDTGSPILQASRCFFLEVFFLKGFHVATIFAHRKNRRDRQAAAFATGLQASVHVIRVDADVSNGTAVITFNQAIQALPAWSAAMMTFDNNGVARVDSAWSLTSPTTITVTIAALAIGSLVVTFGSAASAMIFTGGGTVAGVSGGGGVVA